MRGSEIVRLIDASRHSTMQAVDTALIDLYWQIGETISRKIEPPSRSMARMSLHAILPNSARIRGCSRPNLFRIRQFYEAYKELPIV